MVNFYCSPNPVARVFFGASCVCGVMGTTSLGGIPITGWLVSFGARAFNRAEKYTLRDEW